MYKEQHRPGLVLRVHLYPVRPVPKIVNRVLDLVGQATYAPGIKGVVPVSNGNVVAVDVSTSERNADRGVHIYGSRERRKDCQSDEEAREEGASSVSFYSYCEEGK